MIRKILILCAGFFLFLPAANAQLNHKGQEMIFSLQSTAFQQGTKIPNQYSCHGEDISPPLFWKNAPANTKSFVLILEDPDAPAGVWDHWLIFNIPATSQELPEKIARDEKLSDGSQQGLNSWPKLGYNGPCPPSGTHRYFFKIYALDKMLDLSGEIKKNQLLQAMKGHVLGQADLMGLYP